MTDDHTHEQAEKYARQLRENDCVHVQGWGVMADMLDAYAATLRQQAGRVDEVLVSVTQEDSNNYCLILTALGMEEEGDAVAEVKRLAALAQNTQGDAVAEVCSMFELRWVGNGSISRIVDRHGIKVGDKLYLHAERARVPEALVQWELDCADRYKGPYSREDVKDILRDWRESLAAAPSQRAEVDRG